MLLKQLICDFSVTYSASARFWLLNLVNTDRILCQKRDIIVTGKYLSSKKTQLGLSENGFVIIELVVFISCLITNFFEEVFVTSLDQS